MNPILETGSAAALSALLTSLFKFAWPSAPSWALIVFALAIGIASTMVVSLAAGEVLTTQTIATNVIQGIIAAGGAAGIDRTGTAAQARREQALRE